VSISLFVDGGVPNGSHPAANIFAPLSFKEINTSSIIGLFKEIVVDHSIMGEPLEDNIVVIAACNPCRTQAATRGACLQENDLGKEWASGHYQVVELPSSLDKVKWAYGSLTHSQEKDFIYRRMEKFSDGSMSPSLRRAMTEVVAASHEAMRDFAGMRRMCAILKTHCVKLFLSHVRLPFVSQPGTFFLVSLE